MNKDDWFYVDSLHSPDGDGPIIWRWSAGCDNLGDFTLIDEYMDDFRKYMREELCIPL